MGDKNKESKDKNKSIPVENVSNSNTFGTRREYSSYDPDENKKEDNNEQK